MKRLDVRSAARDARSAQDARPATALLHDVRDARLVIFRIEPGQAVAPHASPSTVILMVVEGTGVASRGEDEHQLSAGDLVVYEPNELHGMRATDALFVVLAMITPRPGSR